MRPSRNGLFRCGLRVLALGLCGFLATSSWAQIPQIPNFLKGKPHIPGFDQFLD